jgi:hypothetical protein
LTLLAPHHGGGHGRRDSHAYGDRWLLADIQKRARNNQEPIKTWSQGSVRTSPKLLLTASSPRELLAKLSGVLKPVPRRGEGRKAEHAERYTAGRVLATLADTLAFPLALFHRDRPDFQLRLPGREVGIEHQEVVSQNDAYLSFLRDQGHGAEVHFIRRARIDEPQMTRAEALAYLDAEKADPMAHAGDGWEGDGVEKEWAKAMVHFAQRKVERVVRPGFEALDELWLLLYDNWPQAHLDPDKASRYLITEPSFGPVLKAFSRVFVLNEGHLWEFDADGSHSVRLI